MALDLAESGVAGSIPPEIGDLAGLQTLDLSNNALTADIPSELGGLRNLTELNLGQNRLTGLIPWELGWLTKLTDLQLARNQLTGRVPVALGSMYQLWSLGLWGNQLEECLPFHLNRREPPYIDTREWPTCEAGSYAFNIRDDACRQVRERGQGVYPRPAGGLGQLCDRGRQRGRGVRHRLQVAAASALHANWTLPRSIPMR